MNRRSFFAALAALPFVGRLVPARFHAPRDGVIGLTAAEQIEAGQMIALNDDGKVRVASAMVSVDGGPWQTPEDALRDHAGRAKMWAVKTEFGVLLFNGGFG